MATSTVTSANIKPRSESRRAMPARVDTRHRELSSRCWPALVSSAVLPADVGQVMELVAGHGVGDGAHAADGPGPWGAALPGRRVEATEERGERGAHRGELGHDIDEPARPEVGRRR